MKDNDMIFFMKQIQNFLLRLDLKINWEYLEISYNAEFGQIMHHRSKVENYNCFTIGDFRNSTSK